MTNLKKNGLTSLYILSVFFYTLWPGFINTPKAWGEKKLRVITSLFPLQEFSKAVGGDKVTVDLLLPPGAEPHTWEPKPKDIITLTKSDIFIYIGAGIEPWIDDLVKSAQNNSLLLIEAVRGIELLYKEEEGQEGVEGEAERERKTEGDHKSGFDPHIWLDFENDQLIIEKIAKAFCDKDPERQQVYTQNAQTYKDKLREIDKKYTEVLRTCPRKEILLGGHSAFAYLARRYHLKQLPLYGINPDAEPRPRDLARLIDLAKKKGVKAVFFERLINDDLARVIAQEIGGETLVLNPGANLTKAEREEGLSFITIMKENLVNLKKGLGCE